MRVGTDTLLEGFDKRQGVLKANLLAEHVNRLQTLSAPLVSWFRK